MAFTITTIFDSVIGAATPTTTAYFSDADFIIFNSDDTGDYFVSGLFIEVACALLIETNPALNKLYTNFPQTINTIDLITIPTDLRGGVNMQLLINPTAGFHARFQALKVTI